MNNYLRIKEELKQKQNRIDNIENKIKNYEAIISSSERNIEMYDRIKSSQEICIFSNDGNLSDIFKDKTKGIYYDSSNPPPMYFTGETKKAVCDALASKCLEKITKQKAKLEVISTQLLE